MMAETVVYSREFLFIKEMYEKGELGKIQYLPASHPQDMDGWPDYWETDDPDALRHARRQPRAWGWSTAGPSTCQLLRLGHGARRHREEVGQHVRRRVAATSRSRTATSSAHIWRFLYDTARQYRESFDVYGTKKIVRVDARRSASRTSCTRPRSRSRRFPRRSKCPTSPTCCPSRSAGSRSREIHDAEHLSFIQGGGHGGSHPHLVNEFVTRAGRQIATRGRTP